MRRTVSRGEPRKASDDVDVEVRLGDVEADEVVRASGREDRVGGRERNQTGFGHARGRAEQQLLGHAHLEEPVWDTPWRRCACRCTCQDPQSVPRCARRLAPPSPARARTVPTWSSVPDRRTMRSSPTSSGVQRMSYECSFVAGGQLIAADLPLVGVDAHEVCLSRDVSSSGTPQPMRVSHRMTDGTADGIGVHVVECVQQRIDIVSVDALDVPSARRPLVGDRFGAQHADGRARRPAVR